MNNLRILIVEDTQERQTALVNLVKQHAWVMVNTAARANKLIEVYKFDLIFLDYDLDGEAKGDVVAGAIKSSQNSTTRVIIHSMNDIGSKKIKEIFPDAERVPFSKIFRNNQTAKQLKEYLELHGTDFTWENIFKP